MREVYDTRFFIEYFCASDEKLLAKIKESLRRTMDRYISAITLHEVHKFILAREGRKSAESRSEILKRDFKVVKIDADIAIQSAELRHKYRIPMADSIIAATACKLRAPVITDDEHFKLVEETRVRWF
jgi:predicted nucleic acid-binding protein